MREPVAPDNHLFYAGSISHARALHGMVPNKPEYKSHFTIFEAIEN